MLQNNFCRFSDASAMYQAYHLNIIHLEYFNILAA